MGFPAKVVVQAATFDFAERNLKRERRTTRRAGLSEKGCIFISD